MQQPVWSRYDRPLGDYFEYPNLNSLFVTYCSGGVKGYITAKNYSGKSEAGKTINTRESKNNKVYDIGLIDLS